MKEMHGMPLQLIDDADSSILLEDQAVPSGLWRWCSHLGSDSFDDERVLLIRNIFHQFRP